MICRAAAFLSLVVLLSPLTHAQNPYDCYPDFETVAFGPSPFPNPEPGDALTAPDPPERPAARLRLIRASRHSNEARSSGTAHQAAARGGGTSCATDFRTQQWNGTAWGADNYGLTATYDAAGRLLTNSRYGSNGSVLVLEGRDAFTYDGAGRLTGYLVEDSFGGSALQPSYRETYTHDAAGRLTGILGEDAVSSGWAFDDRYTFGYGEGPYATSLLVEMWNGSTWTNDERAAYTYTAGNQVATVVDEAWQGNAWRNDYREQYAYDGASRLTSYTGENPVGPTGWEPSYRILDGYDGAGRVAEERYQQWTGSAWEDRGLTVYAYAASGQLSEAAVSFPESPGSPLTPSYRDRFTYAGGRLAERAYDRWNGTDWQPSDRRTYSRDVSTRPTEIVNMHWDSSNWINDSRELLRYDGSTAAEGGPAAEALALTVGPNPASASVSARFALAEARTVRLTVVDALGREVLTVDRALGAGEQTLALDTARLAPGLYVVRLHAGALAATRRLVVAR